MYISVEWLIDENKKKTEKEVIIDEIWSNIIWHKNYITLNTSIYPEPLIPSTPYKFIAKSISEKIKNSGEYQAFTIGKEQEVIVYKRKEPNTKKTRLLH